MAEFRCGRQYGFKTGGLPRPEVAEIVRDEPGRQCGLYVAHHDHGHAFRPVPCVVVIAQKFGIGVLDDTFRTNGQA